jgi:transcriptional regulator with XRE-family HTH domain
MLITRLMEIAKREKRCDRPTQQQVADVCGLTRSRIAQIKADRDAASLNSGTLLQLTSLGYSAAWVQHGKGDMMVAQTDSSVAHFDRHRYLRLIEIADQLSPEGIGQLEQYAEKILLPNFKLQSKHGSSRKAKRA